MVFVEREEGIFEPREVRTGLEGEDGYVPVISGLFPGEQVVVSGQFLLDSESRTREAIAKMRSSSEHKGHEGHEHNKMDADVMDDKNFNQSAGIEPDPDLLYICPMCPEFVTTDPDASCPECGMDLVKLKDFEGKLDLESLEFYTCSMHPEFLTTDPEGRCPECGMKLEKVKKKEIK
jgi:rubrerythrin